MNFKDLKKTIATLPVEDIKEYGLSNLKEAHFIGRLKMLPFNLTISIFEVNKLESRFCGLTLRCIDAASIILLVPFKNTTQYHQLIVHECLHAVHNTLDSQNIPLNGDTEELYASMLDKLFYFIINSKKLGKGVKK